MLELSQVVSDIQQMGAEAKKRGARAATQMQAALGQATLDREAWAATRAQRESLPRPPWLAADCKDTPPATVYALPPGIPEAYTALATDGSQIPLDRHAIAPCYLLNVGEIVLHYGTGERPRLSSQATLHYRDEELYVSEGTGDPVPLSDKIIANRRLLAESAALAALIEAHKDRHAVALVDDPLIVWTPQGESGSRAAADHRWVLPDAGGGPGGRNPGRGLCQPPRPPGCRRRTAFDALRAGLHA